MHFFNAVALLECIVKIPFFFFTWTWLSVLIGLLKFRYDVKNFASDKDKMNSILSSKFQVV